ncbi:hypothetical protein VV869_23275 [Photobacterium sp. MCCC 1A19761]|uniref:hypothetical protein n=1 Tax=Photobacterium sp. MCCC 1A19761 TaxID=3115000 RepID=UPI00307D3D26
MEDFEESIKEERYYVLKLERQQRLRIVMAVVPALIGVASIFFINLVPGYTELSFPFSRTMLSILAPLSFLISGMSVLMIYLQTGFKKRPESNIDYLKYENELRNLRKKMEHSVSINPSDLEALKSDLTTLKDQVSNRESLNEAISSEYREELVSVLKKEIIKESKSDAFADVLGNLEEKIKGVNQLKEVEVVFSRTLERLYTEIDSLSRRGNINLGLGILTTIIGLVILGYFVLEIDSVPDDKMAFIAHFIPRLSLVVLIEIFAYFFLKLYKSSLSDIKYFQNEMTNSEAKLAAIKCSIMTSDSSATSSVIHTLASTERNAVLEKGQTTAEIEKAKIEQQNIATISDKVSNFISSKKST